MKKILTFFAVLFFFVNFSCSNDDSGKKDSGCDFVSIVNEQLYSDAVTDNYMIIGVILAGDCLEVTLSSSGCSADNWEMSLIGSENVNETLPAERDAKIELVNDDACLAVFLKTNSFDLTPLRVEGENSILLHIEGWENDVLYEY